MPDNHYDYVVVGSGPGGAVVAHRLQEGGADVLLIEAGRRLTKETFPRNEADVSAQLYWGGGLELTRDASMGFLRAKVLGGTTIVNQALLDRFDEPAWDDWRSQSGISFFSGAAMSSTTMPPKPICSATCFVKTTSIAAAQLVSGR